METKNVMFHFKKCVELDITNVDKFYAYFATYIFFLNFVQNLKLRMSSST